MRLAFALKIFEADQATLISVLDSAGNPDNSEQARHLLTQIQGQLR